MPAPEPGTGPRNRNTDGTPDRVAGMTPNPTDPKNPENERDDTPDLNGSTVPYSPEDTVPLQENRREPSEQPEPDSETDPEAETAADVIADQRTVPHFPPEVEQGPEQIDGYELMGRIGRGGMGTVYMARRLDDRFRKRVAIKVMRRGMDTDEMLERFQLERQVLGALNHPNIARLYDAGATADGRPFFVMEYVDGQQITDYCDENGLSIPDRIRLFTKVCAAVHYAHQNLIVHRDLKPSNILVTADGEPKLLDFGIAKLLNPELLGLPALTRADQRIMTYEYASPEQVKGQQITTASDVYALGVILYELLTGHRPYQIERRLHAEAVRVICEEEPERPSTAVSKAATHHTNKGEMQTITAAEIARRREAQISRLRKNLAGDLDNIILMALHKSAQRRYPTAIALADDLNRHLAGQTVTARSPTLVYRAGKFLRRHRVGVGVAGAMLAVLLVSVLVVSVAWRRAEAAYARESVAHEQTRRAENAERDARVLAETRYAQLRRMFTIEDSLYERIEALPSATAARDILSRAMLDAIGELAGTYPDDPALRLDLARQYHRVGVLAAGGENAIGRGIEALARASELFAAIPEAAAERIDNDIELSKAYRLSGDLDAAARVATEAADRCAAGGVGDTAAGKVLHARALMQAGLVRMLQSRYDDAEPLL
ncbi:MAG TPA: serine/threonine protein kinase, partial [Phycisphaerales bacterium]|nr:serine/threonine protein kinase [Phycisphaerales bacterium]